MNENNNHPIDFVITWVDGNDPVWRAEKAKYQNKSIGDMRDNRYRDWDTLRYWFRGVERYAPWVNHVFFVTYGHFPKWLNVDNPKLTIVNHRDYIPVEYLPTFSNRPIELNFHRIHGLSEHFVYFNDDMFLLKPVQKTDFFIKGLPCDSAVQDVISARGVDDSGNKLMGEAIYSVVLYNTAVINRNFNKKDVIRKNRSKWYSLKYGRNMIKNLILSYWNNFTGFKMVHYPYSYLKSTYEEVWRIEPEVLSLACSHKFRTATDVSQYVFSNWQMAKGQFMPRDLSIGKLMSISNNPDKNEEIYQVIKKQKVKLLCVNDQFSGDNFEVVKKQWQEAFEVILPEKSGFEKY
ncbi:MAG: Stealth CR1 domain-containing protein [Acidaminococcaceae bacterium]|nr:Stealth CR1 domain-containing protein [Acidaminococcaceae bacterium]